MKRTVLVISNPDDEHTRRVMARMAEFGTDTILFCPEQLGKGRRMMLGDSEDFDPLLRDGKRAVSLNAVDAIWYRRPRLLSATGLSPEGVQFAREEWRAMLEAAYALAARPLWVSHPDRLRLAARKPYQLQLARLIGMAIPRTLITNNPEEARAFASTCDGKVVAKPTGSGWLEGADGGDLRYVLTNRVEPTHLSADDEMDVAPVTFQEEVPKAYELRVHVVGQRVLTVRIDSQQSVLSALDWRRYDIANTPYTPYSLPKDLEQKCLTLTKALGLEFSAIDLIRRPDGEYVFLETNGNGQFLWAEDLSGVPVSDALASLLSGVTPPLTSLLVC